MCRILAGSNAGSYYNVLNRHPTPDSMGCCPTTADAFLVLKPTEVGAVILGKHDVVNRDDNLVSGKHHVHVHNR